MNVKEAMSTRIMTIDADATVAQARKKMVENNIRRLVVDLGAGEYGVVTVRDVVYQVVAEGLDANAIPVRQIMNKPAFVLDPAMDIKAAAVLLKSKNVAGGGVFENGKLIGIVTLWDILVKLGSPCACK